MQNFTERKLTKTKRWRNTLSESENISNRKSTVIATVDGVLGIVPQNPEKIEGTRNPGKKRNRPEHEH